MTIKPRPVLLLALAIATPAYAADPYPTRPIRHIVNSAPGAQLGAAARAVAQKMSEYLGQTIVVETMLPVDGGMMAGPFARRQGADMGSKRLLEASVYRDE